MHFRHTIPVSRTLYPNFRSRRSIHRTIIIQKSVEQKFINSRIKSRESEGRRILVFSSFFVRNHVGIASFSSRTANIVQKRGGSHRFWGIRRFTLAEWCKLANDHCPLLEFAIWPFHPSFQSNLDTSSYENMNVCVHVSLYNASLPRIIALATTTKSPRRVGAKDRERESSQPPQRPPTFPRALSNLESHTRRTSTLLVCPKLHEYPKAHQLKSKASLSLSPYLCLSLALSSCMSTICRYKLTFMNDDKSIWTTKGTRFCTDTDVRSPAKKYRISSLICKKKIRFNFIKFIRSLIKKPRQRTVQRILHQVPAQFTLITGYQ